MALYLAAGNAGELAMFVAQADIVTGYFLGGLVVAFGLWALWYLERNARTSPLSPDDQ